MTKYMPKPVKHINWALPVTCKPSNGRTRMHYPLRIPEQLKPHLRALRKSCGLTQAQLGALVGVKQARIAEIESLLAMLKLKSAA